MWHLRDIEDVTGLDSVLGLVVYRGREVIELDERIWAVPDTLLLGPEADTGSRSSEEPG